MDKNTTSYNDFIAGSVGGMLGAFVGFPLDTLKITRQTNNKFYFKNAYRGVMFPLIGEIFNTSLVFGVYGNLKKGTTLEGYTKIIASSFTAGLLSALFLCPLELYKIRKQLGLPTIHNWTKGLYATIMREIPFNITYFMSYECAKNFIKQYRTLNNYDYILAGGIAGSLGWTSSYPIDVIKTKIQTSDHKLKMTEAFKIIYNKDKLKGFYKGYIPTIIRAFPVNATCFLVYESVMKFLNK